MSIPILGALVASVLSAPAAPHLFSTADQCSACHDTLVTPSGEDISMGVAWGASVMANSAKDPYWQAAVRREGFDHPSVATEIEHECSVCHMPMAHTEEEAEGRKGEIFSHLPVGQADAPLDLLAQDGVSCTACHQIEDVNLGAPRSFTGGFVVDTAMPWDQRVIFGPYDIQPGNVRIMHSASAFQQQQAQHLRRSELCATCHTLYTKARGPDGKGVGILPEQVPFLEWRHSRYRDTQTCQSCHMPVVEGPMAISSVGGPPREHVSRHTFQGGNFLLLRMLNRYRAELGVTPLPQELDASIQRTEALLRGKTATVTLACERPAAGEVQLVVALESLTGHKFPSAYPSRRAWLHVTARTSSGQVVFESGALRKDGSIVGNANDEDPHQFERHYDELTRPDQVQIYESIMATPDDQVTTGLLSATHYIKDNRLLPHGFDKMTAEPDIAVHGDAATDGDFTDRGDHVTYSVPVTGSGPFRVEAELLYQPIGFRWAHNLEGYHSAAEPRRFTTYYDAMSGAATATLARAAR